jgi:nitroreductase
MDVFEAIRNRRAVRSYTAEPIEQNTIERLIALAVRAPSARNLQPWAFAVVRGRDRLKPLSERAKAHLLETLSDGALAAAYRDRLADPAFDLFYGASHLVLISATSDEDGASEDCALAAQNLMLAAHALELGTCWIGFARRWLNQPEAKAALGLPPHYRPVAPIIIGHPGPIDEPPHPRKEPEILWIGG